MADLTLQKPSAGQNVHLAPDSQSRLVFEFKVEESTLHKEGDSLLLSFDDGANIVLDDFYVAYTSESMPQFHHCRW